MVAVSLDSDITFGESVRTFFRDYCLIAGSSHAIEQHNLPVDSPAAAAFYRRYFSDRRPRVLVLGINPGRKGSGASGVPFTDTFAMQNHCEIDIGNLQVERELTAGFMYDVINKLGGPSEFYQSFFLSATVPVCLTKGGNNFNYYDDAEFLREIQPSILLSLQQQLTICGSPQTVIIIGTGKNYEILASLNKQYSLFRNVHVLPHPRYILQYRRRELANHVEAYLNAFSSAIGS